MTDIKDNKDAEKEPENAANQTPQEPVLSPKNDDELIIEIDEKQQIEPIAEKVAETAIEPIAQSTKVPEADYASEELMSEESEEIVEAEKPKVETKAQRTARLKQEKHKKHEKPKKEIDPNAPPKKSKLGMILIVALFLIVAAGAYLFVINPSILAKQFPSLVEKGILTVEKEHTQTHNATPSEINTDSSAQNVDKEVLTKEEKDIEASKQTEKTIVEEKKQDDIVVKEITKTLESQPAPKKEVTKTESTAKERIVTKGKLQTPCWIISYSSISNEAAAIKTVATLSSQGIKSGYYWIPDYVTGGPKLFKVYVGPFQNKDAALSQLPQIKENASGAYVTEVK